MKMALFSMDPGTTTGYCAGILDTDGGHPVTHMSYGELVVQPRAGLHATEQWERAAMVLFHVYTRFRYRAVHRYGVAPDRHVLVSEDYQVRPSPGSTKREALAPVYVMMTFQGIRMGSGLAYERMGMGPAHLPEMRLSSPNNKKHMSDARQRRAGFWFRGEEHARDAAKHFLLTAMKLGFAGVLDPRKPGDAHPFW